MCLDVFKINKVPIIIYNSFFQTLKTKQMSNQMLFPAYKFSFITRLDSQLELETITGTGLQYS